MPWARLTAAGRSGGTTAGAASGQGRRAARAGTAIGYGRPSGPASSCAERAAHTSPKTLSTSMINSHRAIGLISLPDETHATPYAGDRNTSDAATAPARTVPRLHRGSLA